MFEKLAYDIEVRVGVKLTKLAEEYSEPSEEKIQQLAKEIDFDGSIYELQEGIEVEKEHGSKGPEMGKYEVTADDDKVTAEIAAAHLEELPDYYTRLEKMEEEGEEEWEEKAEKLSHLLRLAEEI